LNLLLPCAALVPTPLVRMFFTYVPDVLVNVSAKVISCEDIFLNWAVAQGLWFEFNITGPVGVVASVGNVELPSHGPALYKRSGAIRAGCVEMLYAQFPDSLPIEPLTDRVSVRLNFTQPPQESTYSILKK